MRTVHALAFPTRSAVMVFGSAFAMPVSSAPLPLKYEAVALPLTTTALPLKYEAVALPLTTTALPFRYSAFALPVSSTSAVDSRPSVSRQK